MASSLASWSRPDHELTPNQTGRLRAPFLLPAIPHANPPGDKVDLSRMSRVWFAPDHAAPRSRPQIRASGGLGSGPLTLTFIQRDNLNLAKIGGVIAIRKEVLGERNPDELGFMRVIGLVSERESI